ncbi:MAG: TOBE domain-containing protein, partial [Pseudomonadota bacterium]
GPVFRAPGVVVPLGPDVSPAAGAHAVCGLRPSDLAVDPAGGIEGVLSLAEKTGAEQNLHLRVGEERLIACAPRDLSVAAGQAVRLSIPPERVHLFDPASGRRI